MRIFFVLLFIFFHLQAYDQTYQDYSLQNNQPTAIGIVAYNRPQYIQKLLASLSQNPESQTLPFFFFLDGGDFEKQSEIIKVINESPVKHKFIIPRTTNYGCPKNHIDAKRFLFDWCNFRRIIVIEEDVIVSKNYISTLLNFHDWANSNYSNIGTVQLWTYCHLTQPQKKINLHLVKEVDPNWSLVTYCMGKNVWDTISPILYEYEESFINPLLNNDLYKRIRSKPGTGPTFNAYQRWIVTKVNSTSRRSVLYSFSEPVWLSMYSPNTWRNHDDGYQMNQDQITSLAINLMGYTRLQTVVNRVMHIGEEGLGGYEGTKNVFLDEFEEDAKPFSFKAKKIK